jgi:hypothetical protein
MDTSMQLSELRIRLNTYGENVGQYTGQAEFVSRTGEIKVVLDHEVSADMLKFLAPRLGNYAANATEAIRKSIETSLMPVVETPQITDSAS